MRRSSLYLALVRLLTFILQFAFQSSGTAPRRLMRHAIAASPEVRDQLRAAPLAEGAPKGQLLLLGRVAHAADRRRHQAIVVNLADSVLHLFFALSPLGLFQANPLRALE